MSIGAKTLAIDIGGTGLKAGVLGPDGKLLGERLRVPTPVPAPPKAMLQALAALVKPLAPYDRVSAGFPGVVRDGKILTAPHFGTKEWRGFPLAQALSKELGKPARVLNDADVQGYGAVRGKGLELVLTFGTGMGSALFLDGKLLPHMEFAQFPVRKGKTYNDYVGRVALEKIGKKRWNRRVERVIEAFRTLLNFDVLYLGGGNSRHIALKLPEDVRIVSNLDGLTGGLKLWV